MGDTTVIILTIPDLDLLVTLLDNTLEELRQQVELQQKAEPVDSGYIEAACRLGMKLSKLHNRLAKSLSPVTVSVH